MSKKPLISIITVSLNNLEGLRRTMHSVFDQTWQEFEYIIIDGGSTDGSKELIEENKDCIDHWISERDSGIYNAMNKGIKMAKGKYLLFLNSGDHFCDQYSLAKNQKFVKDYDLIFFDLNMVGENQQLIGRYPSQLRFSYFVEDTLPHPSTFISSKLFKVVGFFDEDFEIVSDWKFFMHSVCRHNCTYKKIDSVLSTYYLDGISSKSQNVKKVHSERTKILYQDFPLFMDDYYELKEKNRFLRSPRLIKFSHLEKSFIPRKLNSLMFRLFLR